jgi:predicted nucleotidyltransferase
MSLHGHVERLLVEVTQRVRHHYGARLVSLVVFGSIGRGTARPDSDVDLLIVAENLPDGRMARVERRGAQRAAAPAAAIRAGLSRRPLAS